MPKTGERRQQYSITPCLFWEHLILDGLEIRSESLGKIGGTQHAGIDIDSYGFSSADKFSYVRITDNGDNRYGQGWAGADIDAVGAISSEPVSVPEPATIFGVMAVVGAGIFMQRKSAAAKG